MRGTLRYTHMANSKKGGKAPAPKAPKAPTAPPPPAANTATQQAQYLALTQAGAKYSPRTTTLQGNAASWATVTAFLQANGGKVTLAALQAHLAQAHNHANFAKYTIRRGWLGWAK